MPDQPWKTDKWFVSPWNFNSAVNANFQFAKNIKFHDVTLRDGEQQTGVILSMDSDGLEVKVLDSGSGPRTSVHTPDIDKKIHGEEPSRGLGMFLIQSLVDKAEWVSSPPSGSYVRLVILVDKVKD